MRCWLIVGAFLLLIITALDAFAQLKEVPQLTGPVVDQVGVLGARKPDIEAKLRKLKQEKGSEVAVLIVESTAPETIEQFSIRVVDQWKLGRKGIDDGVLILVAIKDRTVRIEVGRGFEGDIPDVIAFRIIQERVLPRFRQGDVSGGIDAAVQSVIDRVHGVDLPTPSPEREQRGAGALFVVMVCFFVGSVLAGFFGSAIGASLGALGGMLAALFFSSVVGALAIAGVIWLLVFFREVVFQALASGSRGYYSSGRGGYRGSSAGGGFGSGGGFSGGGASGRW